MKGYRSTGVLLDGKFAASETRVKIADGREFVLHDCFGRRLDVSKFYSRL